ncbi:Nucleotidyl transferase [Rubrobacter radiotolerans]|uniref:Nucleotidyl transferase n=1 Tax=Rubrobacter radiotolerans TaxID=42256 RepID=A0A023X3G0_RUBRA|nr:sugar phosphate nucleotidyltransferase [Rubrobacter radiotolerans]AHY46726.1 Nucleotidyl transferase [Rubrobacter radiotolerans]MDX5894133.1 sugar phosphate nucleotidyltransferase [Rubrobacter radiotolerans]SMC05278.1 mannose-1-phosphate guanylyltransferase / phosphomannomutase [Rubrobacter radiotolerans DSM 5868]
MKTRKAVIMAGGQGTRLRPLTNERPKPMIPIANVPCMEHIVNLLARHGFEEIVATLQFMPEEITDHFGDGSEWGVNIRYSVEDSPAGTAGSVKLAERELDLAEDERFLVISGDALTDADLGALVEFHERRGSVATMVLKSVANPLDFGIVITDEDGRIQRFLEKPAWGQVFSDTVNTGIYLLDRSVLREIPSPAADSGEYDFSKDLFPKLLSGGAPIFGYVTEDYWEDIGTLEQYASAQRDVLLGRVEGVRPPGLRLRDNIYVARSSRLGDEESLEGPVSVGENVRIDEGAVIKPHTVIGSNVVVASGARLERCVVSDGTYIGEGAELYDTVVGRSCYIQARARLQERSSLGDDVIVGEGALIAPDVKVYPHKTIEDRAHVTQSLIYETMGLRTVFRGGKVTGRFNVDLTPEFVVRLASSFGSTLDAGSTVTVGRDAAPAAHVAKRAMTAALLGTGVNVRDLRAAHAGVVRHDVLAGKSSAGAHLRAGSEPDEVEILFFSDDATPISEADERGVEKHFVREEYRRAHGEDIGELIYPGRAVEQYVERLERASEPDGTRGATIVADFSGGVASLVASRVFSRLGVNAVVVSGFANANARGTTEGADTLDERLARVERIVPTVGATFGCVVGSTGEPVSVVDDAGERVPQDVMLACVLLQMQPERVVLPVDLSARYRRLVELYGGSVEESRSGMVNVAIKAAQTGADLAALDDGSYVFPSFMPAADCFMTISCLLKLFSESPISSVRSRFGNRFARVVRRDLDCPWSAKGRVMRELAERFGGNPETVLTDGVKVALEDAWVLMLPDPENPTFHVYCEHTGGLEDGPNTFPEPPKSALRKAEELADRYADLVQSFTEQAARESPSDVLTGRA